MFKRSPSIRYMTLYAFILSCDPILPKGSNPYLDNSQILVPVFGISIVSHPLGECYIRMSIFYFWSIRAKLIDAVMKFDTLSVGKIGVFSLFYPLLCRSDDVGDCQVYCRTAYMWHTTVITTRNTASSVITQRAQKWVV